MGGDVKIPDRNSFCDVLPWQENASGRFQDALYQKDATKVVVLADGASDYPGVLEPFAGGTITIGSPFKSTEANSSLAQETEREPDMDEREREALLREEQLREAGSPEWAERFPTTEEAWHGLNVLRHSLIEKEMSKGLIPVEAYILGTLEIVSDKRIHRESQGSLEKARQLLAQFGEDTKR